MAQQRFECLDINTISEEELRKQLGKSKLPIVQLRETAGFKGPQDFYRQVAEAGLSLEHLKDK